MRKKKWIKWAFFVLLAAAYGAYCFSWLYPRQFLTGSTSEAPEAYLRVLQWRDAVMLGGELGIYVFFVAGVFWAWLCRQRRDLAGFVKSFLTGTAVLLVCFGLTVALEWRFFPQIGIYTDLWLPILYLLMRLVPCVAVAAFCRWLYHLLEERHQGTGWLRYLWAGLMLAAYFGSCAAEAFRRSHRIGPIITEPAARIVLICRLFLYLFFMAGIWWNWLSGRRRNYLFFAGFYLLQLVLLMAGYGAVFLVQRFFLPDVPLLIYTSWPGVGIGLLQFAGGMTLWLLSAGLACGLYRLADRRS